MTTSGNYCGGSVGDTTRDVNQRIACYFKKYAILEENSQIDLWIGSIAGMY